MTGRVTWSKHKVTIEIKKDKVTKMRLRIKHEERECNPNTRIKDSSTTVTKVRK